MIIPRTLTLEGIEKRSLVFSTDCKKVLPTSQSLKAAGVCKRLQAVTTSPFSSLALLLDGLSNATFRFILDIKVLMSSLANDL